jgi:protein tyrosine phosphatase (PTP) superfamily phosphohydrolase (DUF442 family)
MFLLAAAFVWTASLGSELSVVPKGVQPVSVRGVENAFVLSKHLYSSGSPETEGAFRCLQKLGIKTAISVDGAPPLVEMAKNFGIRYIHLPIGYNGTTTTNAFRLIKAAESSDGPVLIHCHHGQHRGPAAAALIAESLEGWTPEQALDWLKLAGTSPDYAGLFAQVATFQPPTAEQLGEISSHFPERASVPGIVDTMVQIDRSWDQLRKIGEAGYHTPANRPDLDPAREAVLLAENFREFLRSDGAKQHGEDFQKRLASAEKQAWEIHTFLKQTSAPLSPSQIKSAHVLWSRLSQSCADCHKAYRN